MPTVIIHDPTEIVISSPSAVDERCITLIDRRGYTDIYTTELRARAIADAFNFPAPDLLAAIDPRLNEVTQIGVGNFEYRGCEFSRNSRGGFDWASLDDSEAYGCADTIFECLSDVDEWTGEMDAAETAMHDPDERGDWLLHKAQDDARDAASDMRAGL